MMYKWCTNDVWMMYKWCMNDSIILNDVWMMYEWCIHDVCRFSMMTYWLFGISDSAKVWRYFPSYQVIRDYTPHPDASWRSGKPDYLLVAWQKVTISAGSSLKWSKDQQLKIIERRSVWVICDEQRKTIEKLPSIYREPSRRFSVETIQPSSS